MSGELKAAGHVINHKRVRRLMGEMNLKSVPSNQHMSKKNKVPAMFIQTC
ncbi:IS3 family transposase [Planococcus antarcticus]